MGPQKLNFHVTYNSKSKPFMCEQHEVAKVISSHFNINLSDVTMYTVTGGERHTIFLNDIRDLMNIEIVPNKNGEKTIQVNKELETTRKMVESIKSKLQLNSPLNGPERRVLIDALETHSTAIFQKRKLEHTDIDRPMVSHKKLQVNMPADNKESFCQTDSLNIISDIEIPISYEDDPRGRMKRLLNNESIPNEEIDSLMEETYVDRRNYITVSCPPVRVVKEQYPALFIVGQVKKELDRIFYRGKCKEFLDNMDKYTKHILHYRESKTEEILAITEKARSCAHTPKAKSYAEVVGSIFVLAKLLDEDFGFIHLADYPQSSKDLFPHIDASLYSLHKMFFEGIRFPIIVEGNQLCEATNFPEAILCLMATFFIFNIDYPESCRCTLTVIEKVFLKANDTTQMDDKTHQWIKLLTMRESKSREVINNKEEKRKQSRLEKYLRA